MKRIKMLLVLLLLSSCTSLTIKSLDILSNDIVQDKDQFLKNILYAYSLVETIDKKYGYTLVPYKYKDTLFFNYKKKDSKNVLVYVHGGAFYIRTVNSFYYTMNEKILENCPKDYEIILLDYKGLKYPEQNKELENVLDYVQKRYDRIVLMGDSSGGNLILSQILKRRDEHKKLPDGLVLLSPWTDLTNTVKSRKDNFTKDVLFGKTYPKLLLNNPYIEDVKDTLFFNYKKKDSKNVLVYVHGGAFYIRTVNSFYYTMNEKILENCPKDYEIILLDYKGLKYPEQNKELENVLDYVQKRYDRIVLMGDSSGGNLILSQILKRRDEHKKLPDGLVLLSPWTDLTNTVKSRKDNFTKDVLFGKTYPKLLLNNPYIEDVKDKTNPYISPVYGDYHNFPKTLIQCGSTELLLDDSRIVYENMKENKVDAKLEIYDNMVHVFQLFGIFDRTDEALKNVSKFLGGIYKW